MIDTIYDEIVLLCKKMSYRDKFRLAQLLIQLARKEEEIENCQPKLSEKSETKSQVIKSQNKDNFDNNLDRIEYIIERLNKSKPKTRKTLNSFITSMFQFKGAISDLDVQKIISELQKNKYLSIDSNNQVTYL